MYLKGREVARLCSQKRMLFFALPLLRLKLYSLFV